jgi:hypothetical protein
MDTSFNQIISILNKCGLPYEVAIHCLSNLKFEDALELGATRTELLYIQHPPVQVIELTRTDYTSLYNLSRAPPTRTILLAF